MPSEVGSLEAKIRSKAKEKATKEVHEALEAIRRLATEVNHPKTTLVYTSKVMVNNETANVSTWELIQELKTVITDKLQPIREEQAVKAFIEKVEELSALAESQNEEY